MMLSPHLEERVLALSGTAEWALEVGRIFCFEFIPAGFFSRLTVRLLHLCKSEGMWSDLLVVSQGKALASLSGN